MSERETKEFKTTRGTVIKHYTYLRGRDANAIQAVYTKGAEVNMVGGEVKVEGFNINSDEEATKKTLELLVVSVNGSDKNVVEDILDLPNDEYKEIVTTLNELSGKKKE